MSRLILLNGAPGSGKSTLARRFGEDHPLALVLDVDQVRGMLGRWVDRPVTSGLLARGVAIAMARAHLGTGHDVIVPQYLGRLDFVEHLQRLADVVGADFVELALSSDREDVVRRFERRSATSEDPAHRQAAELQRRSGGREQLAATHDELLAVVAARPATRVIKTSDGNIAGAYADMLAALGECSGKAPCGDEAAMTENPDAGSGTVPKALPPLAAEDHACARCKLSYTEITIGRARAVIAELPGRCATP